VCPWNHRFAGSLPDGSPFAARKALAAKDARQLARELLGMPQEQFSAAFRGSPLKRAKLRGLKRNAAVALGNVGTADDLDVLTRALDDPEPLVRQHATWARDRIRGRSPVTPPASGAAGISVLGGGPRAGDADSGAESRVPGPR
jgi:epoxyqueuosine reductase